MKYSSTNTQQAYFLYCQARSRKMYMMYVTDNGKWSMGGVFEIQCASFMFVLYHSFYYNIYSYERNIVYANGKWNLLKDSK